MTTFSSKNFNQHDNIVFSVCGETMGLTGGFNREITGIMHEAHERVSSRIAYISHYSVIKEGFMLSQVEYRCLKGQKMGLIIEHNETWKKWLTFWRWHFQMHFSWMNKFSPKFHWSFFLSMSSWQLIIIGSGNGLLPNRQIYQCEFIAGTYWSSFIIWLLLVLSVKLLSGEWHNTSLIISQHWFR